MWERVSPRARWALIVLLAALALVALDAWWIAEHRHGYPLDIDEAGYMWIATNNHLSLELGGLHAWWDTIQMQAPQAPLLTTLTSLVLVFSEGTMQGFATLAGFLVLLAIASYGIAERLAGPRLGALAAIVVAASPGAFAFSREFIFALPAAAFLACAVYAILRSEGLRSSRWAIACGAAIGLMLLSRTMGIAYVPGVAAAGVVALAARPREEWLPGLLNLALLAVSAFAVAATWYWRNIDSVYDYLTGFGYGSEAANFGEEHATLSWGWWHAVATLMTSVDLLLPLAVLILAGLVALAVAAVRRVLGSGDRRETLVRLLRSDTLGVAIVFAVGYLALSTSTNAGSGFTFPLAILLPPIAVVALREYPRAVIPAVTAIALVTALNVLATSSFSETLAKKRNVHVPLFGTVPWTNGVPRAVETIRVEAPGPETRFVEKDRGWPRADIALSRYVFDELSTPTEIPLVAFGMRNRVFNTNTVQLGALSGLKVGLPVEQLIADEGNGPDAYEAKLTDPENGVPGVVLTTSSNEGDFTPLVDQESVETAARRLHFRIVRTMQLPNGVQLRIWFRRPPSAAAK
jgi:4-amino-4-deoxy-L-arabinose transferase-like glycosyltransferase